VRVVIAKKLLSTIGGSEALARSLDRELRALGHDVTLVGLRPAWARPGVPRETLAAPPGPVTIRSDGAHFVFIPARGGRVGAAVDGLLPTTLVAEADLRRAVAETRAPRSSRRRSFIRGSRSPARVLAISHATAATTRSSRSRSGRQGGTASAESGTCM